MLCAKALLLAFIPLLYKAPRARHNQKNSNLAERGEFICFTFVRGAWHKTEHIVHVQTLKSITERSRHRSAAEKEWRVKKKYRERGLSAPRENLIRGQMSHWAQPPIKN
jgi:hypothetical protein